MRTDAFVVSHNLDTRAQIALRALPPLEQVRLVRRLELTSSSKFQNWSALVISAIKKRDNFAALATELKALEPALCRVADKYALSSQTVLALANLPRADQAKISYRLDEPGYLENAASVEGFVARCFRQRDVVKAILREEPAAATADPVPRRLAPSPRPENPGPNGPRSTGTIKTMKERVHKWSKFKGDKYVSGFIVPDDGSEEIFYMARDEDGGAALKIGQRVSYVQETNSKGPIANYAEPLADAPLLHGTVTAVKPRNTPTYGFVRPDAGGDDVFVSFVDVESAEGLAVGDRVAYELVPNAGARKSNRTSGEPKFAVKCGHVVVLPKGAAQVATPVPETLRRLGLERLAPLLAREQIDEATLPILSCEDLVEAGLCASHARMIVEAVQPAAVSIGAPARAKTLAAQDELDAAAVHQARLESSLFEHRAELRRLRSVLSQREIPDALTCPITLEIMKDPCMACDGFTYERSAIESWLTKKSTSPKTGEPLSTTVLFPNHGAKQLIAEFLDETRRLQAAIDASGDDETKHPS